MLVMKQKWISRIDLQNNPNVLYLFGDNLQRMGLGGQAAEMRGEDNALGIATKRHPYNTHTSFFYDCDPDVFDIIDEEFKKIKAVFKAGRFDAIVIPSDGIGTGLADLQTKAPKLLKYIEENILNLCNV